MLCLPGPPRSCSIARSPLGGGRSERHALAEGLGRTKRQNSESRSGAPSGSGPQNPWKEARPLPLPGWTGMCSLNGW